jgi:hypothetical protein
VLVLRAPTGTVKLSQFRSFSFLKHPQRFGCYKKLVLAAKLRRLSFFITFRNLLRALSVPPVITWAALYYEVRRHWEQLSHR